MTISAKVIADSISPAGKRITTLQLKYPRFIHSEFMTHRAFSRCASSSRAIPVETMIKAIENDLVIPSYWGSNKPGMQAGDEIRHIDSAVCIWGKAANAAIEHAKALIELGVHKQITNRLLEPFMHISVVVTATEWSNFFELRCHKDAQPEFRKLAYAMHDAMVASSPNGLDAGEWHLPYITDIEREIEDYRKLAGVSAARCARVSYLNHDQSAPNLDADLLLFEKLVGSVPKHASPVEHQAICPTVPFVISNNFRGWTQFRAIL